MLKLLKKSAFVSLGLAVMSASTIKRVGKKIADESNMSEAEGKEFVEDLLLQSKKSKEEFKNKIESSVKESITELNLAKADDIESLKSSLDKIEELIKSTTKKEPTETNQSAKVGRPKSDAK